MILDPSAILALIYDEHDAPRFADAIADASVLRIGATSWFEAAMIVDRRSDAVARARFEELVTRFGLRVEPFTAEHAALARRAWRDYGRGSGHPARLNFGDCLAYGFAKAEGQPLLFKGNDFVHTDIESAMKA